MLVQVYITDIKKQTEKAALVGLDNGKSIDYVWVPKSQVKKIFGNTDKYGHKYNVNIIVPKWLADNMGVFAKCWDGTSVYNWQWFDESKL